MRIILRYFFLLLIIFSGQYLYAQKEANTWYFGRYLGLDFNSGTAVPLNDGQLNTTEGVATISNSRTGSLLFYTDGSNIWNRLHLVMPNGAGLFGNFSSTQSAIVVPKIGDTTRYYVFTVDALLGTKGINYSIVNMTLDNGKGDVEVKNVPINKNSVEKITAVKHCNNKDVWVIAHDTASNGYYAYLVTAAGVNTTPVISRTGVVLPGKPTTASFDSSWLGYLKASPDGKKIAAAHWTVNVDVSDFDNATGVVSNSVSLYQPGDPHYLSYGVEFSPNSNLLYSTSFYTDPVNAQKRNVLFQYDVTLGTGAAIRASKQIISSNSDPIDTYASLQIAPDGKMYMAKRAYKHISAISYPNVYGPGCNFISNAIQFTLPNQESSYGLPTFVQSYFYPIDSFTYKVNCPGLNTNFTYTPPSHIDSVRWDFGDPASGVNNSSVLNNPVHTFSSSGIFNVLLIRITNCGHDTLRKQINTNTLDNNLGPDLIVCGGTNALLNASASGSTNTFLWQDGSTNPTLLATAAGLYWVQATNSLGCTSRDSINVNFNPNPPVFNLGLDSSICSGDTLLLNATVAGATSYLWSTADTTPTIKAAQAGTYWSEVNKGGCKFRDSLTITSLKPMPLVNLGNDVAACGGNTVALDATNPNCTYLWQNGNTSPVFSATTSGLFWVEVTHSLGCKKRDSVNLIFNPSPVFNLGKDSSLCSGDTLVLNATVVGATSYLWNTGATTPTIKAARAGIYWCEVNNGCIYRDSLTITAVNPTPVVNLGNDIATCGGNTVTLDATNPNTTYLWQDGSANATLSVTTGGLYWVVATHNSGCTKRDSINVVFNAQPVFNLGRDSSICAGDTLLLNATVNGATSYLWSTGATTPTIRATQAGIYWCEVNNGCVYRDSLIITSVKPSPAVNLGNDITTCGGNSVALDATNADATYLWQNGSTNPVLLATTTGLFWVEVKHNLGCTKRDSINLVFNPTPVFNLGADKAICAGDSLLLNATVTGATSYRWNTGTTTPTISVSQAGIYWCEVSNGCLFRDSLTITSVQPLPVVNLGPDKTECEGITANLDATYLNSTYLWQDGSTNPIYAVSKQGNYFVKVNLNGCFKSDTIQINYNLKPTFTLGPDQYICQGNSVTLSPVLDPAWLLRWQDGSNSPTYMVTQPGLYNLTATNNCGTTFGDVMFYNGICKVFVPSAFTPNGDGLNDVFRIAGTDVLSQFNLKIFNRYGQVIFETSDRSKGWDGKLNGKDSPGGGFVYLLNYTENNTAETKTLKGTFMLIR